MKQGKFIVPALSWAHMLAWLLGGDSLLSKEKFILLFFFWSEV